MNWLFLGFYLFLTVILCYVLYACAQMQKQITALQNRVQAMRKGRERFYASLSDPNAILADMERGAVAMEALQAKRRRNIRDDAGPHARVWKPKKMGRLPQNNTNRARVEVVPDEQPSNIAQNQEKS